MTDNQELIRELGKIGYDAYEDGDIVRIVIDPADYIAGHPKLRADLDGSGGIAAMDGNRRGGSLRRSGLSMSGTWTHFRNSGKPSSIGPLPKSSNRLREVNGPLPKSSNCLREVNGPLPKSSNCLREVNGLLLQSSNCRRGPAAVRHRTGRGWPKIFRRRKQPARQQHRRMTCRFPARWIYSSSWEARYE